MSYLKHYYFICVSKVKSIKHGIRTGDTKAGGKGYFFFAKKKFTEIKNQHNLWYSSTVHTHTITTSRFQLTVHNSVCYTYSMGLR